VTPQEEQLLTSLTEKINQTQLQEKDPDAEDFLRRELGSNPDALYILAQTVLVQNIALEQAKAQVAQLQQQAQARPQPAHATTFLGRLLGEREPEPAPPPPAQPQGSWSAQAPPPYQPVPQYQQPQYAPPQYQAQPQYVQSGQPSFLRGAMQTAAGVAAGALAFEGVESILHGFGHSGYGMGGMGLGPGMGMGGGFERPVEETVINNYYDQPGTQGFEHDRPEGEHHHEGAQFSDAGYNSSGSDSSSGDDQGGYDDSSNFADNSGFDNGGGDDGGSGFDDGGGFDSGGGDLS
jgi:hypothetical protein